MDYDLTKVDIKYMVMKLREDQRHPTRNFFDKLWT